MNNDTTFTCPWCGAETAIYFVKELTQDNRTTSDYSSFHLCDTTGAEVSFRIKRALMSE